MPCNFYCRVPCNFEQIKRNLDKVLFVYISCKRIFTRFLKFYLHCALAVVQCIVIGPVCVCVWVGLLP